MNSQNFEYLRPSWGELATLGAFAEQYTLPDPSSATVKLRTFAEQVVQFLYHKHGLPKPFQNNLNDLLINASFAQAVPKVIVSKLLRCGSTATRPPTANPCSARPPCGSSRKRTSSGAGCSWATPAAPGPTAPSSPPRRPPARVPRPRKRSSGRR